MARDPLERDYGLLLGIAGPIMIERAEAFRKMAAMVDEGPARDWLESQAQRCEEAVRALGRKLNGRP